MATVTDLDLIATYKDELVNAIVDEDMTALSAAVINLLADAARASAAPAEEPAEEPTPAPAASTYDGPAPTTDLGRNIMTVVGSEQMDHREGDDPEEWAWTFSETSLEDVAEKIGVPIASAKGALGHLMKSDLIQTENLDHLHSTAFISLTTQGWLWYEAHRA
jgi:hypothetical protein